ncbi:MAG: hypothetical protein NTX42_01895 [Methanothrix sp.]|nr:hypothetical protein [Methanothrix sp.]
MIKTDFLVKISILLLLMMISAQGQPDFGQTYTDSQYANEVYPPDQYSSTVPTGAPVPVAPNSPQELGLQIPSESATYTEAPPATETSRALIPADAMQYTGGQVNGDVQKAQYSVGNPSSSMMVIPQGATATNKLYVSYVPQTVAGCRLYGWLPMWLQTSVSGPIWFYEWYPSGQLSVNYLGIASRGWQKKWFNADTPGWHILQYHSRGWSNYIYIYVYPASSGRWTDQGPYAGSTSTTTPSYSGTSTVTLRSSWLKGYEVYLDGKYIGTEGKGSDILDGLYSFRVPGNMWHTIVISKNGQSYDETGTFVSGAAYRFTL